MSAPITPKVAVSYSWKEERGSSNAAAVEAFCAALRGKGIAVIRDSEDLKLGQCISEFMISIGASDFLCVFLSDAYLKSPNCMYEMLIAWEKSRDRPKEFRERVKVWVMPGLQILSPESRLAYTDHWQAEAARVEPLIKKHAGNGLGGRELDTMRRSLEIAEKINDILSFVAETLSPRSADEFEAWITKEFTRRDGTTGPKSEPAPQRRATLPGRSWSIASLAGWGTLLCVAAALAILLAPAVLRRSDSAASTVFDATVDRPYINTMGMEFVPVSIGGGPTDTTNSSVKILFSVTDTTVQQYRKFLDANANSHREWPTPGFNQKSDEPAVMVSWDDASAFCNWLTREETGKLPKGAGYRLPRDHEWSCGVGIGADEDASESPKGKDANVANGTVTVTDYPWGREWGPGRDGKGNYDESVSHDGFERTSPVKAFPRNKNHLYDMGGNVWQWCSTVYDFAGAGKDTYVLRGASWANDNTGGALRSAYRHRAHPSERSNIIGFRCVLEAGVDFDQGHVGAVATLILPQNVPMRFCYCQAGNFTMGSPVVGEKDRGNDEGPVHVTITRDFWLEQTELTQGQWKAVMGEKNNPSSFQNDELPVEEVKWDDANNCVNRLNAQGLLPKGWKFALPTEAQWEYACRAGTTGPYSGNLNDMAWYVQNYWATTHPVCTRRPNGWGLYDMHGNVWEWCADWYESKLKGGDDPTGPKNGSDHVIRGGSYYSSGEDCRSAKRGKSRPGVHGFSIGFRPAVVSSG